MKPFEVHYIGDDPDFISAIENYIKTNKAKVAFSSSMQDPISVLAKKTLNILYIDFTSTTQVIEYAQQACFLKRIPQFQNLVLIALFKEEEELKRMSYLFSSGIQYSYIKGCELTTLFKDSMFLITQDINYYTRFAEAKSLFRKLNAGVCSNIIEMSQTNLKIESQLKTNKSIIDIEQKIFPEIKKINVASDPQPSPSTINSVSYELSYPTNDPWADDPENGILPETVDTWVDLHQEHFSPKKDCLVVIEPQLKLLSNAFNLEHNSPLSAYYYSDIGQIHNYIQTLKPAIIFIECSNQDEDSNSITELEGLIRLIGRIEDYRPIFILGKMPSSSSAVQKLLGYPQIVCSPHDLEGKILDNFCELFVKKMKPISSDSHRFTFHSEMRPMDIVFDLEIIKLTEHEITFRCEEELPFLTVLHFTLPIEFYATVVKPLEVGKLNLKTAIIHGISEKKLEVLRQFINILIENPNLDFKIEEPNMDAK